MVPTLEHSEPADTNNLPLRQGEVAAFYDEKTQRLLDKYQVGYRVHYHTGLSDGVFPGGASTAELRERMHAAQVLALDVVAEGIRRFARMPEGRSPDLLDIGCGLGGGSLRWAEEFGARVRAITVAAEHVPLITQFAASAGLGDRIEATEQDANHLQGEAQFDIAVGFESICHMDRRAVLTGVARLLRAGGSFHVFDWMRGGHGAGADRADAYWHTRMGTPEEHRSIAAEVGLELVHDAAVHEKMVGFWALARAWNQAAIRERAPDTVERARLERSSEQIALLEEAFRTSEIRYHHMVFIKP